MRDFEKDRLSAARFSGDVPASDFSWSIARHDLFHTCLRAYFIRYYLAQGGWDPHADELARMAYQEKYVLSFDQWLSRMLQEAMIYALKKMITGGATHLKKSFSFHFLRFISKAASDLQYSQSTGEYQTDPKRPVLREFLRKESGFEEPAAITRKAVQVFSNAYDALINSDLLKEILSLDFMDLRLDDPFLSFSFDSYPVWFAPGLIYFRKDTVVMLQCLTSTGTQQQDQQVSDHIQLTASLFELYIRSKWKRHAISSVTCMASEDAASVQFTPPTINIRPFIRKSAGEMLSRISADGIVRSKDFPECGDAEKCRNCQFSGTCRLLKQFDPAEDR